MPVCPCCHGTQFEVNPLDEALCCVECGTVNQEAELRTESGHHFVPTRIQTTQEVRFFSQIEST
jgi:transcription initiation factor TFIIIB Brf1 subunit/transcription initiation factor TFIIB